jgi:hypothetical protein
MCKESLINSNSVHLGPRTGLPDKMLKGDHQRIIFAKLESNWPSSLRGEKIKFHPPFLFLATVAMLVGCLGCRTQFWKMVIKGLSKVSSNWPSSFRDEHFLNFIPFFIFSNSWLEVGTDGHNFGRGSPADHSTKVWSFVAKWFQRRICLVIVYRRTTDAKWWQRLTRSFGSGELKQNGGCILFPLHGKISKNSWLQQ